MTPFFQINSFICNVFVFFDFFHFVFEKKYKNLQIIFVIEKKALVYCNTSICIGIYSFLMNCFLFLKVLQVPLCKNKQS